MAITNPRQADLDAAKRRAAGFKITNPRQADLAQSYAKKGVGNIQQGTFVRNPGYELKAPTIKSNDTGGGGGSRSRGGGSQNIQAPTISAPKPRSIDWRDASFNAQIAAIDRALRDFETGLQTRGQRYGQDYLTGLRRLGFRAEEGFVPIGAVGEQVAQPGVRALAAGAEPQRVRGDFDYEGAYDPFSAAARGTRSARDEFAARGTLRSTDFNRSFEEFQNRLNQQLEGMETGRSRFRQDLETELAQQRATAEERRGSAQRDAMMRAAIAAASQAGF